MVRVMASGVFDLLHSGHLHFLEEARKLGDELIVVVATDKTVREKKHEPITNQEMRLKMVAALRPVDLAVPLCWYIFCRYRLASRGCNTHRFLRPFKWIIGPLMYPTGQLFIALSPSYFAAM